MSQGPLDAEHGGQNRPKPRLAHPLTSRTRLAGASWPVSPPRTGVKGTGVLAENLRFFSIIDGSYLWLPRLPLINNHERFLTRADFQP
jgi:hypothetical protein